MSTSLIGLLRRQRVLPVIRTASADEAVDAAMAVIDAGMTVVELTATTPGWESALQEVRERRPDTILGLGTVTTSSTARAALEAGASFLVSPWPSREVRQAADGAGCPFIEGAFSPGEIAASALHGPVKVFPAHAVGPDYLRSIGQVIPSAEMIPTGGIRLEDVPRWLEAGASVVGVGSDLYRGDVRSRIEDVLGSASGLAVSERA